MGQRLAVRTPVVNIGRADYNDLVIPDPSVSTSHAKLQRREGVWVIVDLDSTNGTFVEGERVKGEAPLAPGAAVKLGDVQLLFEPADDAVVVAKGGGTQLLKTPHSAPPAAPAHPGHAASPAPAAPQAPPAPPGPPAPPSPATRPRPGAPPRPSPPAAAAPLHPPRPGTKPAPRRPAGQQPPPKKGKGCGARAAALVLGSAAAGAILYRLLS